MQGWPCKHASTTLHHTRQSEAGAGTDTTTDELVHAEGVARDAAAKTSSLATATLWTVVDVGRVAAVGVAQRCGLCCGLCWLACSGFFYLLPDHGYAWLGDELKEFKWLLSRSIRGWLSQ